MTVSIVWFVLTMFGFSPTHHGANAPAVVGSFIFACVNFWLLSIAIKRVLAAQYAGNRRASVRFEVFLRGELQGEPCIVRDLSLTGARVEATEEGLARGQKIDLSLRAADVEHNLKAEVIRVRVVSGRQDVALRFLPGQRGTVGALALFVLNGGSAPTERPRRRERRSTQPREAAA